MNHTEEHRQLRRSKLLRAPIKIQLQEKVQTQALVTDFMTIYTAELDRNNMAELSPDTWPWQTDLAELSVMAAYGGASGMALQDGKLIRCSSGQSI